MRGALAKWMAERMAERMTEGRAERWAKCDAAHGDWSQMVMDAWINGPGGKGSE